MNFKDYFSSLAKEYSKYRPVYPDVLFRFLNSLVKDHNTAWDCATGSGQAALGLTPYFKQIIATDASASQLEHAVKHSKITYIKVPAENPGLEHSSVDLVTVATAIHWIDSPKFFKAVKQVLKPGGVIAVWTYAQANISEIIDKVSLRYSDDVIGKHWPEENKKISDFNKIEFPFDEIISPAFKITALWSLTDYLNYIFTWSATQKYIQECGVNPLDIMRNEFESVWGNPADKKPVTWKLKIKTGRII